MIRNLVTLIVVLGIIAMATTIPFGKHTLWAHMQRIWGAEETQELVDEVKVKSRPMVDSVKRGVNAGLEEMTKSRDGGVDDDGGVVPDVGREIAERADQLGAKAAAEAGERAGEIVNVRIADELGVDDAAGDAAERGKPETGSR